MNFGFHVKFSDPLPGIFIGGEGVETISHPIYLRPSLYEYLLTICTTLTGIVFGCVLCDIGN